MADISKASLRKEIAAILDGADLSTTTSKKVRQELETKLDAKLLSRKKEIDELVMAYVNSKKNSKHSEEEEEEDPISEEEPEEEDEESEEEKKPKKRGGSGKVSAAKKKKEANDDDSDASDPSAEEKSEEEYSPKKAKSPKARKLPPKKKKKGSDSDSDVDWTKSNKGKKGGKRAGRGYTKVMTLTPELASLVGQDTMARHEVVKKVWALIRERNLFDPKNKQFAICDDALFKVIGQKRFRTFGMMKYLKDHFIS